VSHALDTFRLGGERGITGAKHQSLACWIRGKETKIVAIGETGLIAATRSPGSPTPSYGARNSSSSRAASQAPALAMNRSATRRRLCSRARRRGPGRHHAPGAHERHPQDGRSRKAPARRVRPQGSEGVAERQRDPRGAASRRCGARDGGGIRRLCALSVSRRAPQAVEWTRRLQ
jgi:hypothetical protein